jgi:hypothetical protein
MANYLIQPQADHTANPTNLANAVFAFGVADPGTVSGLTNGTSYVAREFVLSPASAAFTPAIPATVPAAFQDANWSMATGAADSSLDVTIATLPDDGGEVIKDVEYDVDAGGVWTSLPSYAGRGTYAIMMPAGETSYAIRLRAVNAVGASAAGDPKSATSSAAPVSGVPFVDDFSTDTTANWMRLAGTANLVISGGVATTDLAAPSGVAVRQDIGLGSNCFAGITAASTPGAFLIVFIKYTDQRNNVAFQFRPATGEFAMVKNVAGVATTFLSRSGQSIVSGDKMEIELFNNGTSARVKKNGTVIVDLGVTADMDVSDVPANGSIGFRVDQSTTITEITAGDVA